MGVPKNALISLFTLEIPAVWGGGYIRWTNDHNEKGEPMVFNGITYYRMAIEADGFDQDSTKEAIPKLRVGNVDGTVGYQASVMGNFSNCKVTRTRVFAVHMDAANFIDGNPDADPLAALRTDVFYIDSKTVESKEVVEFELRSATNLRRAKLPGGTITNNTCLWNAVADCKFALTCGKTFLDCQTNWDADVTATFPPGTYPMRAFPACGLGVY